MTALLSILVCLVGVVVYALSSNSKAQELGRIAYAMGLLVALLQLGSQVVSLLGRG